jgi:cytochrome c-type biogenesis protein CcsB
MKKLFQLLSSLKLAVILLVLLLVALATGTIIDSKLGSDVAGREVYYAWWFLALQGAFAVNVALSIASLFPWGRGRIGFLLTHSAMILILVGATISYFFKIEGHLGLWEGQSGNVIEDREGGGSHTLPFTVTLDDFQIDYYPGTMRPAMFRSLVRITDPETGKTTPAKVWMNHELEVKGYRLFQSSYQQTDGREASIFSVAKDPGQNVVFLGYGLLVLGMCVVLGTRISARRRMERQASAPVSIGGGVAKALSLLLVAGALGAAPARADDTLEALRRLPVQHDGRAMPFDTLAREVVWEVTGSRSWQGEDPVETVTQWLLDPQATSMAPVVHGGSDKLGLGDRASFATIVRNQRVLELMDQAREAGNDKHAVRTREMAAAEALEGRLMKLQEVLKRDILRAIPPADPTARWTVPQFSKREEFAQLAMGPRIPGWPSVSDVDREITYNQWRPVRIAWIVLVLALGMSIAAWNGRSKLLDTLAFAGLVAGFGVMSWGIALRWTIAGRIPAANMYESLLFLAWGVGLFAVVAFAAARNRLVVLNANAMAAVTMLLTDVLPMDGFIHPTPPVLSGTPWLAIHVPIIMVSYSVLALGVVVAHMQIGFTIFAPRKTETIAKMYDLLYWYILVGSILLVTGILTGSIWAASSWGRYWGWDPKEVWSLVAFLAYMAILHAKVEQLIGRFGVAAISVVAFQTILMTYLGVNYVLGTGLHSYGFGDSPVVTWMVIVALVEAAFLGWGWVAYRRSPEARTGQALAA